MKNILIFPFAMLCMVLALSTCSKTNSYAAEISDLNGVWQPDWLHKASLKQPEEERHWPIKKFSWGEGKYIPNTTFNIDITAETPYIGDPSLGSFPIVEITQTGTDSIKVNAFRADQEEPRIGWAIEVIFHFIDGDTLWIETKDFDDLDYGKGKLWHRLSGPTR